MHEIGQSAGKSFAYILGVYLGDGCVTRPSSRSAEHRRCFKLNTIDLEFAEATAEALRSLTERPPSISTHPVKRSKNDNNSLYCGCDELCHVLTTDTQSKSKIPDYVWDWPRDVKLSFIGGLMDSEGFVGANSNPTNRRFYMGFKCCEAWVPDFQRLLESVGIRTGKLSREEPRKPGYRAPMRFHVKMQSWVDSGARFSITRKQKRVDEWASFGAYERRAKPRRLTSETNTLGT